MKKCSNPHCASGLYPDEFMRCPLCSMTLEEVQALTGSLPPELSSEANTSPYQPVNRRLGEHDLSSQGQYVQQPLPYAGEYVEHVNDDWPDNTSLPLRTMPPHGLWSRVRTIIVATCGFVLALACLVLALSLSNRLSQRSVAFNGASAQTTITPQRPAVNTPILGVGDRGSVVGIRKSNAGNSNLVVPTTRNSPASILDAIMCAKLESGQPVGSTTAYHPADPFSLAVKAEFGTDGVQSVSTRWYGPDGALVYEMRQSYSQKGTYYAGFTVSKSSPWATGDYRTDIYTNDSPQPIHSVSFSVIP